MANPRIVLTKAGHVHGDYGIVLELIGKGPDAYLWCGCEANGEAIATSDDGLRGFLAKAVASAMPGCAIRQETPDA